MAGGLYSAQFWAPLAREVVLVSDCGRFALRAEEGRLWEGDVPFPAGLHPYHFVVDGLWTSPDPFNSRYSYVQGRYRSVLDLSIGPVDQFPESPLALYTSDTFPGSDTTSEPCQVFGPRQHVVVTVLQMQGLSRPQNHVAWIWCAPSGRVWAFDSVVTPTCDVLFSGIPYGAFDEFGEWNVQSFVNGRFCGEVGFAVRSLGYPPEVHQKGELSRSCAYAPVAT